MYSLKISTSESLVHKIKLYGIKIVVTEVERIQSDVLVTWLTKETTHVAKSNSQENGLGSWFKE